MADPAPEEIVPPSAEELEQQQREEAELAAVQQRLEAVRAAKRQAAAPAPQPGDEEEDLLGDTDALIAAAKASAEAARKAAAAADGFAIATSAPSTATALTEAREQATAAAVEAEAASVPAPSSAVPSAVAPAQAEEEEEEEGAGGPVFSNAAWSERVRNEREKEVMGMLQDSIGGDREKLSLFKSASKMYRDGGVTPEQFMRAVTKLVGGPTARRMLPVLADAMPDQERREGLHEAFRAAQREAAVRQATGGVPPSTAPVAAAPSTSTAAQPLFTVPAAAPAVPPPGALTFGDEADEEGSKHASPSSAAAPPRATPDDLFAPSADMVDPAAGGEEALAGGKCLRTVPVQAPEEVVFDPLAAAPSKAAPAPTAAAFDPLSTLPSKPAPAATVCAPPPAAAEQPEAPRSAHAEPGPKDPAPPSSAHVLGPEGKCSTPAATSPAFEGAGASGSSAIEPTSTRPAPGPAPGPAPAQSEQSSEAAASASGGGGGFFGSLFGAPAPAPAPAPEPLPQLEDVVAQCPHHGGTLMVQMYAAVTEKDASGKEYTEYALQCVWERQGTTVRWLVGRRYSEFHTLHEGLRPVLEGKAQYGGRLLPPLPGKSLFGGLTSSIVQQRRRDLAVYLRHLFAGFPVVLMTTQMDAFLMLTPRIGATLNKFLEAERTAAASMPAAPAQPQASTASASPVPGPGVDPLSGQPLSQPAQASEAGTGRGDAECVTFFNSLDAPRALTADELEQQGKVLAGTFSALLNTPRGSGPQAVLNARITSAARAVRTAQACLELSLAASTEEASWPALGLRAEAGQSLHVAASEYTSTAVDLQDSLARGLQEFQSLKAAVSLMGR